MKRFQNHAPIESASRITRRNFVIGAASTLLTQFSPRLWAACPDGTKQTYKGCEATFKTDSTPQSASGVPSLSEVARSKGIDIGTALVSAATDDWGMFEDAYGRYDAYNNRLLLELIIRHCSSISPDWCLKPEYVAPAQETRNFRPAQRMYDFCQRHGKSFHGHTLFWDQSPLSWAQNESFDETKGLYGGYIKEVISRFPNIASWDVLNEIIADPESASIDKRLRKTFFLSRFGIDFVEYCLREARAAAPHAKLTINEYNLSCAGEHCSRKRKDTLSVIRELKDRGAPLDAVGIQGHLGGNWFGNFHPQKTLGFIRRLEEMGLDVFISEMDINDLNFSKSIEQRDEQVASFYYEFLSQVLESKAVKKVCFWGISDAQHWIVRGEGGRTIKGALPRPALFDSNLNAKPSYWAVIKALEGAPARS